MNKKIVCALLCVSFTISLLGCQSVKNGTIENGIKPVTIEYVDNKYYKVIIDYNSGVSHKEMGELLGKEIKNKVPGFERAVDSFLKEMSNVSGHTEEYNIIQAKQMIKNLDKNYVDEIDGLSSQLSGGNNDALGDGKLSKDELYLLNLTADILRPYSCSAISVYGNHTVDGKTITGRDLEWLPGVGDSIKEIPAVTIFKQGNKSFCSIGYVGYFGVISGFNKSNVFASILDVNSVNPDELDDIRSYPFDIRYSLENNQKLDNVAAFLSDKNHNYYRDNIVFFADSSTSKVLENDLRSPGANIRRELRTEDSKLNPSSVWGIKDAIATVNTFELNGNNDGMVSGNIERWESYKRLINEKQSFINVEDMKNIMSFTNLKNGAPGMQNDGSIYNNMSFEDIVFKPEDLELEVAFAPKDKQLPQKPDFLSIPISFK